MGPRDSEADSKYHIEAVSRAIELLVEVGRTTPATISQLATDLGWTKSMVYRMVRTLVASDALRTTDDGFVLGPRMIRLGHQALQSVRIADVLRPTLGRIHEATNESVVLTILDDKEIIYIDYLETDHLIVSRASLGERLPAFCTASGHALLSAHSDEAISSLFANYVFRPPSPSAVSSISELLDRVHQVQERGFALIDGELAPEHRAVAAPVLDHTGAVAASISVSVPAARLTREDLTLVAERVLLPHAQDASRELGFSLPDADRSTTSPQGQAAW